MTRQEAIQEIENWSCVDSGIPHIDSIDAVKIIDKIYDDLKETFGDYFEYPYIQMYAGANRECVFCGMYENENHKKDCLHLKFKEMIDEKI